MPEPLDDVWLEERTYDDMAALLEQELVGLIGAQAPGLRKLYAIYVDMFETFVKRNKHVKSKEKIIPLEPEAFWQPYSAQMSRKAFYRKYQALLGRLWIRETITDKETGVEFPSVQHLFVPCIKLTGEAAGLHGRLKIHISAINDMIGVKG